MALIDILMLVGFALAAYAVVGNDSIQVLGTFIAANKQRPWWLLWIYISGLLVVIVTGGWFLNGGDPSFGLSNKYPDPTTVVTPFHILAPVVILVLTRLGLPISTSFLILAVFNPGTIATVLEKSLKGYFIAFIVAFLVYFFVKKAVDYLLADKNEQVAPVWYVAQWLSTGVLWAAWLMQDIVNVFVFLPRDLSASWLVVSLTILVATQGLIFYQRGGIIQKVVTSKSRVSDVRSATVVDMTYAVLMIGFKWLLMPNTPISTTWLFLGLLAGREIAIALKVENFSLTNARGLIFSDVLKAGTGLVISILFAFLALYLAS